MIPLLIPGLRPKSSPLTMAKRIMQISPDHDEIPVCHRLMNPEPKPLIKFNPSLVTALDGQPTKMDALLLILIQDPRHEPRADALPLAAFRYCEEMDIRLPPHPFEDPVGVK